MRKILALLIVLSVSLFCFSQKQDVQNIDVKDILEKSPSKVYFDEYFSDVEFIPLGSGEVSLTGKIVQLEADNSNFYIRDQINSVTIFSKDGSYVKRLQEKENLKGEFARCSLLDLIPEKNLVLLFDGFQRKLMLFNTEGEFLDEYRFNFSINAMSHLDNNTLIFITDSKYDGTNVSGHIISYVDIESMEVKNQLNIPSKEQARNQNFYISPELYRYDDKVFLRMPFCDTIFQINKNSYEIKYNILLNNTGVKPEMFINANDNKDLLLATRYSIPFETKSFLLFFTTRNKNEKGIIIMDKNAKVWRLIKGFSNKSPGFRFRGIDKILFKPIHCTKEYYYSFIRPVDFKFYFSKNLS